MNCEIDERKIELNLSSFPIAFQVKPDDKFTITIPYWVQVKNGDSYLLEIDNLSTRRRYTKIVKAAFNGKVKKFNFGKSSAIISPKHLLNVVIVQPFFHKSNKELSFETIEMLRNDEFTFNTFKIFLLFEDQKLQLISQDRIMILNDESVETHHLNETIGLLRDIDVNDNLLFKHQLHDVINQGKYVYIRYIGVKKVLAEKELKWNVFKCKNLTPYVLIVLTKEPLLSYLLHPIVKNKIDQFLGKYNSLTLYNTKNLDELTLFIQQTIKSLISKDYFLRKKNSIFDVLFLKEVPKLHRWVVSTLANQFISESRGFVTLDSFLEKLNICEQSEIEKLREVREALSWLMKEEAIIPGKEKDKNAIFVRLQ